MSFWSRIAGFITGNQSVGNRMLDIYVLSSRCREPIAGQVDLMNELSRTEDDNSYYTRKVLHTSGERRCFDQVEVELWFDGKKNVINHSVSGGRWLEEDEYQKELALFNNPPEEEETAVAEEPSGESEENNELGADAAPNPKQDESSG